MRLLEEIFLSFFQTSLTGSLTILVVILALKLLNNNISVRVKHGLWILVILRLLIPVIPEMNINIISIGVSTHEKISDENNQVEGTWDNTNIYTEHRDKDHRVNNNLNIQSDNRNIEPNKNILLSSIIKLVALLWVLGIIILISTFLLCLFKFKRKTKPLEISEDSKIQELINKLNIKIPIYVCDGTKSPCILGIIKPKIYIPKNLLNMDDSMGFSHILLHELMHYKRKDIYYNFFSIVALSLHWFNPLVWIAINKMKLCREYACDACVLETLGEEESIEYGMTLINFSKISLKTRNCSQLVTGFQTNNQIKERIEMIKSFKNGSYKISIKAILGCIIVTTVVFTNCVVVKALDLSDKSSSTIENNVTNEDKHEFLIDSDLKAYNNINKVQKILNFKFKLPNYILEENEPMSFHLITLSDKDNALNILYYGKYKHNQNSNFSLGIFKKDPVESLKKIEDAYDGLLSKNKKVEIEKNPMNVGQIKGESITLTSVIPEKEVQAIKKYFVWENEGIWYSINYSEVYKYEGRDNQFTDVSVENINKIANSLKDINEVNCDKYTDKEGELSTECYLMNIYDKEDLDEAEKIIGFNPKLPLKINDDIVLNDSVVNITDDSNVEENIINYEINSFYSNKNGSITFSATKHDPKYEDIKKSGYAIEQCEDGNDKKIKVEKINFSNKEVLKYKQYNDAYYMWQEEGIYYSVLFFNQSENSEEIVKIFLDSKPIN